MSNKDVAVEAVSISSKKLANDWLLAVQSYLAE